MKPIKRVKKGFWSTSASKNKNIKDYAGIMGLQIIY